MSTASQGPNSDPLTLSCMEGDASTGLGVIDAASAFAHNAQESTASTEIICIFMKSLMGEQVVRLNGTDPYKDFVTVGEVECWRTEFTNQRWTSLRAGTL